MKKILFLFLVVFSFVNVNTITSQTLHSIIFANTKSPGNPNKPNDTGIGPSVTVDFERMGLEMSTISSFIGYNLKKYYYYETQESFSRTSLVNVLNNLTVGPNDIVFFYYSGHGGRFENEGNDYPEMILKVPYGPASKADLYSLKDAYDKIMSKHPRLTIVMGDLCNSTFKGAYKDSELGRGASIKSSSTTDVYKNLFLNVKGGLIVASSKPGHTSGCALFPDGSDAGGCFTTSFLKALGEYVSSGSEVNWEQLLETSRKYTQSISHLDNLNEKQTPVFSTKDLVAASGPVVTTNSTPSVSSATNDAQVSHMDDVASALTLIGSDRNSASTRISNIASAKSKFFNPNARVQVVGRDTKTIVNTTSASSYLNYLGIAVNIDQVMVIEEKKDASDKIVYLKVHEVHRK